MGKVRGIGENGLGERKICLYVNPEETLVHVQYLFIKNDATFVTTANLP